jgi:hypothetical protein
MNAYANNWMPDYSGPSFSLSGKISTDAFAPASEPKGRRAERVQVALGAGLRQRGASGVTVQIMDLSTDGFRVASHLELAVGTDVWLRLPGLEPSHARVVWSEGNFLGCAFARPLHPAVVDMVVARAKKR